MNASHWLDKVIGRRLSALLPAERAAERIITDGRNRDTTGLTMAEMRSICQYEYMKYRAELMGGLQVLGRISALKRERR